VASPAAPWTDISRPLACISFDTEEFDIPLEYGVDIPMPEQLRIGRLGLERLLPVLDRHNVRATFFVTASFARAHDDLIRSIADARLADGSRRHEIASHGVTHAPPVIADLAASKQSLEDQLGIRITGFRAARMAMLPPVDVARAGYTYNASENPIWLPGRYCHIFKPRRPYVLEPLPGRHLVHIPASATPLIRIPLFWLALKNFPEPLLRFAARWTLSADRVLNTYAHPWEYADISTGFGLSRVVAGCSGDRLLGRLDRFLGFLSIRARFGHYQDIAASTLASNARRPSA
jgi:peptidoglycan/xylan/chitin deacetylase (PgdA/CDA1 family)